MKILFVLENYYPNIGGVETLFKSLCESLAQSGYQIIVYTNKFDSNLEPEEHINNVKIIRAPFKNRYLFTLLGCIGAIKHAKGADIIHSTSYNAAIPAFIAGLVRRKKVIITFHEVWGKLWFKLPFMNKLTLSLHYLFEQMLLKLPFHKFIGVSKTTSSRLIESGVSSKRVHTILNGIDYSQITKRWEEHAGDSQFKFTFFGRLGISKGLDLLIPAFEILRKEHPNTKLNIVIPTSPKSFYDRILKIISSMNLMDHVEIHSNLPFEDLQELIAHSNAVVIPSYSEGFCFAAVETMAIGTPIISTDKGALQEVVTGQHIFVEELNPSAIKDALKRAVNDDWDFKATVKYPLSKSIAAYINLYESIINTTIR